MTDEREALVLLRYLERNPAKLWAQPLGAELWWYVSTGTPEKPVSGRFGGYGRTPLAALRAYKKATVAAKTRARKGGK